jgi:hypothetical protein
MIIDNAISVGKISYFIYFVSITMLYVEVWGVLIRVVKVVYFKPLAPHRCGFESRQEMMIILCKEGIQLANETPVLQPRCPFVPEMLHGRAPEVFLRQ